MQRTIPRPALIASCVAALGAFSPGPASAAVKPAPVTGSAVSVTPTSATLTGTVDTKGVATVWEFVVGQTSNPFSSTFTTGGSIPAGLLSKVAVSDMATNLTPSTSYTFELLASTGTNGNYYFPLSTVVGLPVVFKTQGAGSASLISKKLKVKQGRVAVGLKCKSTIPCKGQLAITARYKSGRKFKNAACGSASFTVNAGTKKTIKTSKVSAKCKALMVLAHKQTIKAHISVVFPPHYQHSISTNVKLTLIS